MAKREGSAKSFKKSEGKASSRLRKNEERKNQRKTYPVEIPRFVGRQFEFYYRRVGLRASRDVVDRRSGICKEWETRFENFRNRKLQGAFKRAEKDAYDGG